MEQHAGIDVSLEWSSVCIVDASGKIVRETKVASEPEVLVEFFKGLSFPVTRIGLEAGPLSQWLHAGLTRAGFETVLLETRHVKAALSAMSIKTDRNDARGIAQLMRMGWFRPVHAKSVGSREMRALLVARKQLLSKLMDLEASMRGILRGFGLKMGVVTRKGSEARVRELSGGQAMLERITSAMLEARAALWREFEQLHREMLRIVRDDEICRRLMSILASDRWSPSRSSSRSMIRVGSLSRKRLVRSLDWYPRNTNPGRGMLAAALLEPGTNQYVQRYMKRPM
jgi:transposase